MRATACCHSAVPACLGVFAVLHLHGAADQAPTWEQHGGFRVAALTLSASNRTPGFVEMAPETTNVTFTNRLEDQTVLKNQNLMLGSGVAAGDVDGDGWCDLYFCAIDGRNALFRNLGNWHFADVTERAGLASSGNASTGAVFADVDGDTDLDLLVSSLGNGVRLFLNETNGVFREATVEAALSSRTGSMTMALGDVEGDGDLDLYVCNYGAQAIVKSAIQFPVKMVNGKPVIQGPHADRLRIINGKLVELGEPDVLFLNDGRGKFRAVEWGTDSFLDEDGKPLAVPWDFGLSAQMRDVNGDGAPDIYVCNDFDTPDRFWINDGRGRFRLLPKLAQRSQSFASMGVDFADIDRDGHLDFFVVEMLAVERAARLQQMDPQAVVPRAPGKIDDRPEISRNTLFRARGDGTYEEVANYAGVAASDWSWQNAFLDVDLDGFEDVLVVNGHLFDVQDLDVPPPPSSRPEDIRAQVLRSPRLFTSKRAWRNRGDLRFVDYSAQWSFNDTNICHGFALADLDNDGDLDVVGNRMNAPAWLLRNESSAPRAAVRLKGRPPNTSGIGARVTLRGGSVPAQTQEIISGGKYLSGDDAMRVFAAGSATNKLRIEVTWRNGQHSVIENVQPNAVYEIAEAVASRITNRESRITNATPLFVDVSERLNHVHAEPDFNDFQFQPLLMKKLSQRGPGLCVTDLDGDTHDDLVIGTGRGGKVSFFRGDGRGGFKFAAASEPMPDDVLALVEWSPAPGARGVLATLANYENTATNVPLLHITLERDELVFHTVTESSTLPGVRSVGYCLAVSDYDADGDLDVFLGGHAISGRYPEAASSQLLHNDAGVLKLDAANSALLKNVGLVNSGLWTDLDNDGWPELVLACEWVPVRIFKNKRGELASWNAPLLSLNSQPSTLNDLTGWWTGIAAADFNADGRMDFVVGNWGLNGPQIATVSQPLRLYYGDFLNRGVIDLIETEYDGLRTDPMPSRRLSDVAPTLPVLRQRYATHRAWAAATATESFALFKDVREAAVTTLATMVFLNRGDHFKTHPLPREAQLSPVWSVLAQDFDGDGNEDVFLSQNFFALRPDHPRPDAGRSLWLRGDGAGGFVAMPAKESGLIIYGDQRGAVTGDFDNDGRPDLVVAQNAGPARMYRNFSATPRLLVRLAGPPGNPRGIGATLRLVSGENSGPLREIHGGAGWLSHGSTMLLMSLPASADALTELRVRWPGGRQTKTIVPRGARAVSVNEAGEIAAP